MCPPLRTRPCDRYHVLAFAGAAAAAHPPHCCCCLALVSGRRIIVSARSPSRSRHGSNKQRAQPLKTGPSTLFPENCAFPRIHVAVFPEKHGCYGSGSTLQFRPPLSSGVLRYRLKKGPNDSFFSQKTAQCPGKSAQFSEKRRIQDNQMPDGAFQPLNAPLVVSERSEGGAPTARPNTAPMPHRRPSAFKPSCRDCRTMQLAAIGAACAAFQRGRRSAGRHEGPGSCGSGLRPSPTARG